MDTENTNDKVQDSNENSTSISSDLIRGHINTIILRTLYESDKYGYEIINEIEEKSKGQYSLKQPTLYSALKRLESQDYVTSYWGGVSNGGRRKYFQITDKGKAIVEQNRAEWEYSRTVIDSLISERDYDFSNPPPAHSVDFNILKKSTSRVPISHADNDSEIHLQDASAPDETPALDTLSEDKAQDAAPQSDTEEKPFEAAAAEAQHEDAQSERSAAKSIEQDETESKDDTSFDQQTSYGSQSTQSQQAELSSSEVSKTESTAESAAQQKEPTQEETPARNYHQATPLSQEEKQRIHDNYKALIGEESDSTAYYYAQVAKENRNMAQDTAYSHYTTDQYDQAMFNQDPYADMPDDYDQAEYENPYEENRAISSELLYSNKSPAERNYKSLLNKLYDNTQKQFESDFYEAHAPQQDVEPSAVPASSQNDSQPHIRQSNDQNGNTASNIEFYDVEEKAQKEGLRITTTNGSRNRTMAKSVGNTFNKGKALLLTAVYVFLIALVECIINHLLHNVLNANALYVIIPYALTFVMLGIFLFLYLCGYGKNSRKTQSKSYLSASLVIFINILLIIVVIAYLVIYFGNADLSTGIQILKYAIFPIIFALNLPIFALLYRVNSNRQ